MQKRTLAQTAAMTVRRIKRSRWRKVVVIMASIVVFCTTYALILPAITAEVKPECGLEEHIHTDDCYVDMFICDIEGSDQEDEEEQTSLTTEAETHTTENVDETTSEVPIDEQTTEPEDDSLNPQLQEDSTIEQEQETAEDEENLTQETSSEETSTEETPTEETSTEASEEETTVSGGHVHGEECYEKILICNKTEHTHSIDCYPNYKDEVNEIIAMIDALPEQEEVVEKFEELENSEDENAINDYYLALQQDVTHIRERYDALPDKIKTFVLNFEKLEGFSWLLTENLALVAESESISEMDVYAVVNKTTWSSPYFGGSWIVYNPGAVLAQGSGGRPNVYVNAAVIEKNENGEYFVTQVLRRNENAGASITCPTNGFVYFFAGWYGTGQAAVDVYRPVFQVGTQVTVSDDTFWKTQRAYSSTPCGNLKFSMKPPKDNSELTVTDSFSTSKFITVNLYEYGDDINTVYRTSNRKYPGFQRPNTQVDYQSAIKSTATDKVFFAAAEQLGDYVTSDLLAGTNAASTASTFLQTINGIVYNKDITLHDGTIVNGGTTNWPIAAISKNIMSPTMGSDGYPAAVNGGTTKTSLGYLFGKEVNGVQYSTMVNEGKGSIDGLFKYEPNTGFYSYDSMKNHAQYDSETNEFVLYDQKITSNLMPYPFGNFLPFNDITTQAKKASDIDKEYLQEIINNAYAIDPTLTKSYSLNYYTDSAKTNTATQDYTPYSNLVNLLKKLITKMDSKYPSGWAGKELTKEYFKTQTDNTYNITDETLDGIYSIDYDEATDFFFGMEIKLNFMQSKKGITSKGQKMVLKFCGDDDVWIYIDNVLFVDLTGIHRQVGAVIDFYKGEVRYYGLDNRIEDVDIETDRYWSESFEQILRDAGKDEKYIASTLVKDSNGNYTTFKNYSFHDMHFYYMERGSGSGVCRFEFNLEQKMPTSLYKVDQYGESVKDAGFAVYTANSNFKYATEWAQDDIHKYATAIIDLANDYETVFDLADVSPPSAGEKGKYYIDPQTGVITYNDGGGGNKTISPAYYGRSNDNGEMVFCNLDQTSPNYQEYYTKDELRIVLGDYFILREVDIPNGFRTVSDEVHLSISGNLLKCNDIYGSGVWSSQNALVSAGKKLSVANTSELSTKFNSGDAGAQYVDKTTGTINYYDDGVLNGTLFAVVLKRNGIDIPQAGQEFPFDRWSPVYGSDDKGYTMLPVSSSDEHLSIVIEAAKKSLEYGNVEFGIGNYGMPQAVLENLPGDLAQYYSYMIENSLPFVGTGDNDDLQYVVAYYWTAGSSIYEATAENTVRISSHDDEVWGSANENTKFDVVWGSTIEVPNVVNAVYFQKTNSSGELIPNAVFALYKADTENGTGYYVADDNSHYIVLDTDTGGAESPGKALVYSRAENGEMQFVAEGEYSIDTSTIDPGTQMIVDGNGYLNSGMIVDGSGVITVTADGVAYEITPAKNTRNETLIGYTHNTCSSVNEEGTGHFYYLDQGEGNSGRYFLKEIYAPDGYNLNYSNVKISVTGSAVFANAGTVGDNVLVGNGPGYLIKSLNVFTSADTVNNTLRWLYGALKICNTDEFIEDENSRLWAGFGVDDISDDGKNYVTTGQTLAALTDSPYSETDMMASYYVYNSSDSDLTKLFDYSLYDRSDFSAGIDGTDSLLLWTDSGWSDLAIYQDYNYGIVHSENAVYENIQEEGDISGLFSSSTFIRVGDERVREAQIKKVDNEHRELTLEGAQFVLYRTVGENREYYCRYDDGSVTWLPADENGNAPDEAVMTVDENGSISGLDISRYTLPIGSYRLVETKAPVNYALAIDEIELNITPETLEATCSGVDVFVDAVEENDPVTQDVIKTVYTISVTNVTTYTLPETGAGGTFMYTMAGVLLMSCAAYLMYKQHKRRREGLTS